jgi:membrane protein
LTPGAGGHPHAMLPGAFKRAFANFRRDQMTDTAASLTYYTMMSLFPALLATVSLLGILGTQSLVGDAVQYAADNGAPGEVTDALESALLNIVESSGRAGIGLAIGIAVALYGASGAFGAAGRALNRVYGLDEDRGFLRHKAQDMAATLVVLLLAAVSLISIFLGGQVAEDLFGRIGLGDTVASTWKVARWGVALLATMLIYAIVYAFSPDRSPRRFRWLSPGAAFGVLVWIAASAGFFFYVANFGNYATYGVFAGAVILLLWLWLTNVCLLFGAELNAELERAESAGRGGPPPPSAPPSAAAPQAVPAAPEPARDSVD